jgi:hypothetical protein
MMTLDLENAAKKSALAGLESFGNAFSQRRTPVEAESDFSLCV